MRYFYFLLLIMAAGCNNSNSTETVDTTPSSVYNSSIVNDEDSEEFSDGTWCADVEYYNPNTGTRNTYNLDVEVENGQLVQINFPNGGWLDETHFSGEDISEGECSFTSDRRYQYTVTLNEKGGCGSSDAFRLQRDMSEDIKQLTCPKCGNEKDSYKKLCNDCEDEAETCPKCYGYKMEWDRICSNCQEEEEEERNKNDEDDF